MDNSSVNKILIIRLSSLGDILLTTPVLRAIKKKYPSARIDFVVKKDFEDAILFNPNLARIYAYDKNQTERLTTELHSRNYDLIIDLQNNFRSRALTRSLKVRTRRFKKPTIKKMLLVWFKINLLRESKTITQRYAEAANVFLDNDGLNLFLPDNISPTLDPQKKYIGFCPGAKHFTKRWLAEYFVELGNELAKFGYTVVLFGGKTEKELCAELANKINGSVNLQTGNNLFQIAADMKLCKLVISNDSGLMHTASAVGVPVTAIFGSSVKEFGFAPYGVKNLILENKSLSCRPCSHIGKSICPKGHFNCMKEIKPQFVLKSIEKSLAEL
ncbi:MAG: glycosyltransferase family 9 protein [Bacteroidetes bacterium]|nr:glycosyltransferase family 9 protein [Bacteroidota bacterium]